MPTYNYVNTRTGETWTEIRPIAEMDLDLAPDVVLAPSTPSLLLGGSVKANREADDFRNRIVEPIVKSVNPRGVRYDK